MNNWDKLFNIIWYLFDLINSCIDGNYFLFKSIYLLNLLLNENLRDLSKFSFLFHNYFLLNLWNYFSLGSNHIFLDYLFYYLSHWLNMNSLSIDINWNCLFQINWNRAFNRLINNFFNKLYLFLFVWNSDNFIDMHIYWNLLLLNNDSLLINLLDLYVSTSFNIFDHYLIRRNFYRTVNCYVNDFLDLDFFRFFNIHVLWNIVYFWRHMYRYLHNLLDYFFNYLRNLNYPFDNSWNNYNFLDNSLDLNYFRYLD